MATRLTPDTEDKEKVLIAAHENPDATIKQIADLIDDEYIKTGYVEQVINDYTLPPEKIAELDGEDPTDEDETETETETDESEAETISTEELEESNRTRNISGTEPEKDSIDPEVADAVEEFETLSEQQLRLVAVLVATERDLDRDEIAEAVDCSPTYIYGLDPLHDTYLVRNKHGKVVKWNSSELADEAMEVFKVKNRSDYQLAVSASPNVTSSGEWMEFDQGLVDDEPTAAPKDNEPYPEGEGPEFEDDAPEAAEEPEDEDEDEDEEEIEISEEFEEESPTEAIVHDDEVKRELEELSKESEKSAFRCTLCGKPYDAHQYASMHVTNSKQGPHKGRNGNEPGVIEVDHEFLKEISPRSQGHNGSVSTDIDTEEIFEILRQRDEERAAAEAVEDETETEAEAEADEDDADEIPVHTETRRGNVRVTGGIDARSNPFQGIHERPILQRRQAEAEAEAEAEEPETTPEPPSASGGDVAAMVGFTREEVFGLLSSDAPEVIRRRVFDAIMDDNGN